MTRRSRQQAQFSALYVALGVVLLVLLQTWFLAPRVEEVSMSRFLQLIREDKVARVSLGETEIHGVLKKEAVPETGSVRADWLERLTGADPRQYFSVVRIPGVDDAALLRELEAHRVEFAGRIESTLLRDLLFGWILPIGILVAIWAFVMRRMSGGRQALTFGRSRAKIYDRKELKVTFADVAGVDEARAELMEVVDFLKNPRKYQRLGGRIPKGVLLVGPPGSGKTLLARAVAGEAAVPFFFLSASEFVEMFVGVGAARVRDLFEQAKEKAPCIVFIDELDAIGKTRGGVGGFVGGHDEREQTLNQLLVEMDGFDASSGVIIMAATNQPQVLDAALLRPGRFDRQVVVDKPDVRGREAILRVHARAVRLGTGVDLSIIAARTPGFSGADLANILNEAALLAARKGKDAVEMPDLEEAIDRVIAGLERKSRVLSETERDIVAHHEMGHALVAFSVTHADPVHKITIIPRGVAALGMTYQLPTEDRYLLRRSELEDRIAVLLGGHVAEAMVYGELSTGAHDDLTRATELARLMVMRYGMSERLGPLTFGDGGGPGYLRRNALPWAGGGEREYSEETARTIDEEVRQIVERTYERVRALLADKKDTLLRAAALLKERETLDGEELRRIVAGEALPGRV